MWRKKISLIFFKYPFVFLFWFFWKLDGLSWGAEPLTIHLIYTSWLRTQSSRIYHRTVKTVQTANWDIRDQIFVISFYIFIPQSCKLCKLQTGKFVDQMFVIYLFIYLSHRVVQNVQTTNWDIRGSYIFLNINLTESCKPCKLQTWIFVDQIFVTYLFIYLSHRVVQPCKLQTGIFVDQIFVTYLFSCRGQLNRWHCHSLTN